MVVCFAGSQVVGETARCSTCNIAEIERACEAASCAVQRSAVNGRPRLAPSIACLPSHRLNLRTLKQRYESSPVDVESALLSKQGC